MHLTITGTRKGLTEPQFDFIMKEIIECTSITDLHEGDCIGVDYQVTQMFQDIRPEVEIHCHPSNLRTRGYGLYDQIREPKDALVRNRDMVDESLALWGCPAGVEILRSGTWACIRYARKMGLLITLVMPDGEVIYE